MLNFRPFIVLLQTARIFALGLQAIQRTLPIFSLICLSFPCGTLSMHNGMPVALFPFTLPQLAQAPKGAVNMTFRNSVIFIRVCMGMERSYKIVQSRGKRFNKIDLPSSVYNLCFYGIQRRFKAIPVGFRCSVFLSIFETPPNAIETQVINRRGQVR